MNKTLLSAALIAGFGIAAFAPQTARASDGTITFSGAITGTTCSIAINGTTGASATVTLPTVQTTAFTAAGIASGFVPVTIALTGCTTGATEVRPYFEPSSNLDTAAGYTNYLKNAGTATSVDVMLSTTNSGTTGALTLSGSEGNQGAAPVTITGGAATFNYFAAYVSKAALASANAGSVSTTLVYDLDYK